MKGAEMFIYKKKVTETDYPSKIICDRCKTEFDYETDMMEVQEFHHIRLACGYGSVFGDESEIDCDLCQRCLHTLIEDFCRRV